ncbi:hypothetical protein [Acidicapsa ligni]|uniref:hypothetical protein n=1 Tax=Acidicapsa ligni TaxID=542300 RepID=UPI0021E00B66|nr:hypothetical protein [Acidicapsa ligni]
MKYILGFALLSVLISVPSMAVEAFQTFYLATAVRAGKIELPRGICEMTWKTVAGSQVKLTIKMEDERTVTVPARMVEGMQHETGVVTSVVNGITYLDEFHTKNAKFIIRNKVHGSK